MSKSTKRVIAAAEAAGLTLDIKTMPDATRTAAQAADAVGCDVSQIAKSMIFVGAESDALTLVITGGHHDIDLSRSTALFGEQLIRADAKRVRAETGFAIGGVSPIGHLNAPITWFDTSLFDHAQVWAAAGTPHSVFAIAPRVLQQISGAAQVTLA